MSGESDAQRWRYGCGATGGDKTVGKRVKRLLVGVLALLALSGATWGVNTYRVNAELWSMPVGLLYGSVPP